MSQDEIPLLFRQGSRKKRRWSWGESRIWSGANRWFWERGGGGGGGVVMRMGVGKSPTLERGAKGTSYLRKEGTFIALGPPWAHPRGKGGRGDLNHPTLLLGSGRGPHFDGEQAAFEEGEKGKVSKWRDQIRPRGRRAAPKKKKSG